MNNMNKDYAAKIYAAPVISVTEVEIEGVLCGSPEGGFTSEGYRDGGIMDF